MISSNKLQLVSSEADKNAAPDGLVISKATLNDACDIVSFLKFFKEVAFCEWQDEEHIRKIVAAENARCYLAKDQNGVLVGAIIGGMLGTRATLNHIAISPIFRNNKIGTVLTKTILNDFYLSGIKRVFLFIEDKNKVAFNFWRAQGFQPTTGETTCELDL
ncbi:GNAT family N-acetyltransferase [Cronobacter universalis]|uniref:Acetyltransferase n=1 Tax=Cronobacter universalis NCTC 9529 TaxID=1074000 RepID=A0AAC8ZSU3_9ENTR|nr:MULTISPECIES: GNAT family N-acetyltransferase [Cronobacter]ELY3467872.1 GNAT family N-acetyltransferase [Cronobacter universalis]ALB56827.1 ribosomal-protein-S18p-alanine acetyltransferase [Cronobacter universalis NCTC 9529]EKM0377950.1 GNAT family N-acetyltransferase [Cronobacter turicensis]ELY3761284.1 GNAT family N-acetyltransferase [Cronobacter universalis]ELY4777634.1 GNAT family N-acetyltransferase [Cronobacter turicensis]